MGVKIWSPALGTSAMLCDWNNWKEQKIRHRCADPHSHGPGHPPAAPQGQRGGRSAGIRWAEWPSAGLCANQVIFVPGRIGAG